MRPSRANSAPPLYKKGKNRAAAGSPFVARKRNASPYHARV